MMTVVWRTLAAAAIAVAVSGPAAGAQSMHYPTKPIRLVNPFAPGGPVDIVGRAVGAELNKAWGQPVIVDNRPGAGTTIGAGLVARAAPDGYTLLVTSVSTAVSVSIYRNLPFDLARDLVPVALIVQSPLVLAVNPSSPANSVQEFINLAKAKSGQVIYSSSGAGTISHLAMELFRSLAKIDTLLHVPYKGGGPSVAAVAGGEVQATFDQLIAIMPQARAGKVRALAVSSGKRVEVASELPTFAEAGLPGFEVIVWSAIFAPSGTPRGIVRQLNAEINNILQQREVRERFMNISMVPVGGPPDAAAAYVKAEIARWAKVIQEAGIKPIE